jgi:hypothetical protein
VNRNMPGLSEINIMDWETLDMVVRYTRSVKFEDSMEFYQRAMKGGLNGLGI